MFEAAPAARKGYAHPTFSVGQEFGIPSSMQTLS
jgi:hypothetical protein